MTSAPSGQGSGILRKVLLQCRCGANLATHLSTSFLATHIFLCHPSLTNLAKHLSFIFIGTCDHLCLWLSPAESFVFDRHQLTSLSLAVFCWHLCFLAGTCRQFSAWLAQEEDFSSDWHLQTAMFWRAPEVIFVLERHLRKALCLTGTFVFDWHPRKLCF